MVGVYEVMELEMRIEIMKRKMYERLYNSTEK